MVEVVEISGRGCIEKRQDRSDGMRAPKMLVAASGALLELESLDPEGGQNVNTSATLVVDLVEAFEKVQLVVVWH